MDGSYILDAPELYNQLPSRKKESIIKIIAYVFIFIFYLICFVRAVIAYEASSRKTY